MPHPASTPTGFHSPAAPTFYLVVEDMARASIGPFDSNQAAMDHFSWCKNIRGDSGALVGVRINSHDPSAHVRMTPAKDKSYQPTAATSATAATTTATR